ncbi:cell division protein CrgA [Bifidobacterium polysaccharolyticum]|uniref:Cell division protein CrgA n=1 Tax=Bifidobacterium polysaccharolyticum TaxID=2750967 RepID=A0ABS0QVD2_9BIFI|nr:cell division protein CrgA [Bifidobacterium polysaccharolyticum]MBI0105549.1 cell division protein CrgA [Bifidobacterium polysaccharolyticum]
MAEQQLHDDEDEAVDEAKETQADAENKTAGTGEDAEDEEYGLSMDKVEAVLNESVDKKHMTPQMRRIVQRQEENTRRVEDTIKSTKANPRWFVPLFVTLMVVGLIWIVVYYIASTRGNVFPIPGIGNWNLAVGFGILLVGFLMTMWWH